MEIYTEKEIKQWRTSSIKALFPFVVFVLFYFGFSLSLKDFSKIPMVVAFLVSSAVALMLNHKEKLSRKIELYALGMGQRDIMMMCLIFILVGAFTETAKAIGAVDAAVLIAQSFIPSQFMLAGIFVVSSLISLSIGTSCGTIAAIVPIAVNLSQTMGLDSGLVIGATVGGAMFGDNLSLISDTTIAATRTQNVLLKDKMLTNIKIVAIPAILTVLLYSLPQINSFKPIEMTHVPTITSYIEIIPYILLLILGIYGVNVMFLLFIGTILNLVIGTYFGCFDLVSAFGLIGDGTLSMASVIIISLLAGGLLQMVRYNGGITYIIKSTECFINGKRLCEFGIAILVGIINIFTANNTVAIITAGPIAKEMSKKYEVDPKRTASILDTMSCCVQGALPYGAQILIAISLSAALSVTPFQIIKALYYPMLVGIALFVSMAFTKENVIKNTTKIQQEIKPSEEVRH